MKVGDAGDGYVDASGSREGSGYALSAEELVWLLASGQRRGAEELELLKTLQSALPQSGSEDDPVGELKAVLTNAIIMRTRLAEREADLADLLRGAVDEGRLDAVPVDEDVVRSVAALMSEGGERVCRAAGG